MTATRLRVALADDSGIFRDGLCLLLEAAGVDVVASVADAESLVSTVVELVPDVAVVDVRMPPTHTDEGIRAAITIREAEPRTAVLVLSTYVEPVWAERLLEAVPTGVGYLLKDRVEDVDRLVEALARVARGGVAIDPEAVAALLAARRPDDPVERLTPRERDVLALIAEGVSNVGISQRLFVSVKTVETHVARIFRHLDLESDDETANRRVRAAVTYLRATSR